MALLTQTIQLRKQCSLFVDVSGAPAFTPLRQQLFAERAVIPGSADMTIPDTPKPSAVTIDTERMVSVGAPADHWSARLTNFFPRWKYSDFLAGHLVELCRAVRRNRETFFSTRPEHARDKLFVFNAKVGRQAAVDVEAACVSAARQSEDVSGCVKGRRNDRLLGRA